ncbi:hypothetical protein NDU88_001808 [Pleurodeles waltl]|uniref:Uncharacterized protein n=1 Tax=Pleurodeles waltl TaxID=8319 RepID=A0AAV7Q4X6_PLEWA|nr:hypothetical protein NDU88_001808 [Pleurodeles waltl]
MLLRTLTEMGAGRTGLVPVCLRACLLRPLLTWRTRCFNARGYNMGPCDALRVGTMLCNHPFRRGAR